MSPFDVLILGHFIGDYLFQTSWMAMNKAKKWDALLVHSFVYTLCVSIVAWIGFGGLSIWAILLIFLSHIFLDRRTFVSWWLKTVMKTDEKSAAWLGIMVDQIFHLIILALVLSI
ncbi:DUF3307 domain-containing protein [Bacillus sp. CGMCC 1.16607]|uniref:DUF3307 domain-containing protein n=1 Tax=Bacillus sp. CGMCC 1.16607 TaxID=3351842 RepID=UPI003625D7C3